MIPYSESRDGIVFKVQVVPRASRSEIVGEHNGALRVRVAAAPVDGLANEELVRLLARALRVPRSAVEITAGALGKTQDRARRWPRVICNTEPGFSSRPKALNILT